MTKDADAYRTIGEVAEALSVPQHVLRFWETRIPQIDPLKRGGGRRYYRPDQVALIGRVKELLYREGYTIKGVQRLLKSQGVKGVIAAIPELGPPAAAPQSTVADLPPEAGCVPECHELAALADIVEECRQRLIEARTIAGG